jgi:filamentous hemagglutinin family protein
MALHLHRYAATVTLIAIACCSDRAQAQVLPDGTLPTLVNSANGLDFAIEAGSRSGTNLFHSFSQFSVPTGGSAVFQNAADVQNIFSRVTGDQISNIDGLIQTTGNANLFLLNPRGILFGPNATLNIGGSFVGTTASRIRFADGVAFSATNPTALLTISAPIGLQMGPNPGSITHQSTDFTVQPGQGLALIGGNIALEGGQLIAPSGRIDLASLGPDGSANLDAGRFSYPANPGMDINLSQEALVSASGIGGGSIQVQGRQIALREGSAINSDNRGDVAGGMIRVQASERLELTGTNAAEETATNITARVRSGRGQGSSIDIVAPQIAILSGAQILSRTDAAGNSGNITVQAESIEARGDSPGGVFPGGIISRSERTATGRGGDVAITAKTIQILDSAQFRASTRGSGNAGNLTLRSDDLTVRSTFSTNYETGISTSTRFGTGTGGDLSLDVKTLNILGGATIRTSTRGGNSGNLSVRANTVTIKGEDVDGYRARLYADAEPAATGNAGNIQIDAQKLSVLEGGIIYTSTFSESGGNAGNILINVPDVEVSGTTLQKNFPSSIQTTTGSSGRAGQLSINADRLQVSQGGQLNSSTYGSGNAGTMSLNARSIEVSGASTGGELISRIYTATDYLIDPDSGLYFIDGSYLLDPSTGSPIKSTGNGGVLSIKTDQLRVTGGAIVDSTTSSEGKAGDINVNAKNIEIAGSVFSLSRNADNPSTLSASALLGSSGSGGKVNIVTDRLYLAEGGQISSATYGSGDAGNIDLRSQQIDLVGTSANGKLTSGLFGNAAQGTGNGGDIRLATQQLSISEGATINVGNFEPRFPSYAAGQGAAGEVNILAKNVQIKNAGSITVDGLNGDRGNISLQSDLLLLRNGSLITATSKGLGNGGNINLNSSTIVGLGNSDIIANAIQGQGGKIQITTNGIFGLKFRPQLTSGNDITASSEFGFSGTVSVNTIGVDPNSGLVALPVDTVDPSQKIATGCEAKQVSSFVATGRGGVPENPIQNVVSDRTWSDIRAMNKQSVAIAPIPPASLPLMEATAWQVNAQGQPELMAARSPEMLQVTCGKQ